MISASSVFILWRSINVLNRGHCKTWILEVGRAWGTIILISKMTLDEFRMSIIYIYIYMYIGFLSHGGTPSYHPFHFRMFHEKVTIQTQPSNGSHSPNMWGIPHIGTPRFSSNTFVASHRFAPRTCVFTTNGFVGATSASWADSAEPGWEDHSSPNGVTRNGKYQRTITHRIHGAAIYANIKGVYWWDPCYHI